MVNTILVIAVCAIFIFCVAGVLLYGDERQQRKLEKQNESELEKQSRESLSPEQRRGR